MNFHFGQISAYSLCFNVSRREQHQFDVPRYRFESDSLEQMIEQRKDELEAVELVPV